MVYRFRKTFPGVKAVHVDADSDLLLHQLGDAFKADQALTTGNAKLEHRYTGMAQDFGQRGALQNPPRIRVMAARERIAENLAERLADPFV